MPLKQQTVRRERVGRAAVQMFLMVLLNCAVVSAVVLVHYEFLSRVTDLMNWFSVRPRFRIVIGVFGGLIAHAVEVWIFSFAYYWMIQSGEWGSLEGNFDASLSSCVYFSFTTFTTLGFGDIEPSGYIRYLTGIESLTGLVLITWTASYLFLVMQKHWDH